MKSRRASRDITWPGADQAVVAGYGEPQQRVYLDDHHLVLRWGEMLTVYEVTATMPGNPQLPARVRQLLSFSARTGQPEA